MKAVLLIGSSTAGFYLAWRYLIRSDDHGKAIVLAGVGTGALGALTLGPVGLAGLFGPAVLFRLIRRRRRNRTDRERCACTPEAFEALADAVEQRALSGWPSQSLRAQGLLRLGLRLGRFRSNWRRESISRALSVRSQMSLDQMRRERLFSQCAFILPPAATWPSRLSWSQSGPVMASRSSGNSWP